MLIDLRRAKKETGKVSRKSLAEMPAHKPAASATRKISPKILGLAGAAIAILLLAFFFLKPGGSTRLNPDMSFRVLSTPYPEVWYPSLYRDGNWIAFPSKNPDGLWGVYFMNSAGGDARRITTDSTKIFSVEISPDGTNPEIDPRSISFSYDDKEAVYATKRISGKLVLIEDFIK